VRESDSPDAGGDQVRSDAFLLAETYDPSMLAAWQVRGGSDIE
jgi:hypothetical protein